jgi:predicted RNase H-like nuclease (RuvC/YqgF family)
MILEKTASTVRKMNDDKKRKSSFETTDLKGYLEHGESTGAEQDNLSINTGFETLIEERLTKLENYVEHMKAEAEKSKKEITKLTVKLDQFNKRAESTWQSANAFILLHDSKMEDFCGQLATYTCQKMRTMHRLIAEKQAEMAASLERMDTKLLACWFVTDKKVDLLWTTEEERKQHASTTTSRGDDDK